MIFRSGIMSTPGAFLAIILAAIAGLFLLVIGIGTGNVIAYAIFAFCVLMIILAILFIKYVRRFYYVIDREKLRIISIFPWITYEIPISEIESYFNPSEISYSLKKIEVEAKRIFEGFSHGNYGNIEMARYSVNIIQKERSIDGKKKFILITPMDREGFFEQLKRIGIPKVDPFEGISHKNDDPEEVTNREVHIESNGILYENKQYTVIAKSFGVLAILTIGVAIYVLIQLKNIREIALISIVSSFGVLLFSFVIFLFLVVHPYSIRIGDRDIHFYYKLHIAHEDFGFHSSEIYRIEFEKDNKVQIYCHDSGGVNVELSYFLKNKVREFAARNDIKLTEVK